MNIELILMLCAVAFSAGFVDAIAGGGGLIQTPLSLSILPNFPVASLMGSLKIPAFSGTALATLQYLKKAKIEICFFIILAIISFVSAFLGSYVLTKVDNDFMKPLLFVILLILWIFTYLKRDFSHHLILEISKKRKWFLGIFLALVVGFYDGFIGPATGTFFIMGFIFLIGLDFFQASLYAKMINLATNFGGICLFLWKGQILWEVALPMMFFNGLGGYFGAKMAILKGQKWVRYIFLFVMFLAICRFGYEIF